MKGTMSPRKASASICIVLLLLACAASAHKVSLFAYVQGETIVTEAFFGGKAKAVDCLVEVFDTQGRKIKEGKTDASGIFSFPVSDLREAPGDVKFVLSAGMGHRADYVLPATDMKSAGGTAFLPNPSGVIQGDVAAAEVQPQNSAVLKKLVEDSVKAQLEPVVTMLGLQQKLLLEQKERSASVVEIIGGIGWIFGIVGVWAYFAGRKQTAEK